jgi:hypothetical protein
MKQYKISTYYVAALLVIIIGSCSKIDDYKAKFLAGGSITYPGKMDSVKAFSGKSRVMITGLFTSDPNIVKYRVFWNSRQDSVEVAVKRTTGVDTAKLIIPNLPEGLMSFEIRTYDIKGNTSIPVNISANVYGDLYQSSILNRAIADATLQANGSALITWADVNKDGGSMNMRIKYSDTNNITHDTLLTSIATGLTTSLPKFKAVINSNTFSYNTLYLPNPTAIDTFYVAFQNHSVKFDVTKLFLTNSGPFIRATYDGGRWGTLAAPWITSPGVINHSGFGGYAAENGGCLVMESGWSGTANIINGKIYQTVTLPAGNYIFQVDDYTEALDPVYIVASAGIGLPDITNISSALGYTHFSTPPAHFTGTIQFPFTIAQTQAVSLGFLATMISGNQYWRVTSTRLIKN